MNREDYFDLYIKRKQKIRGIYVYLHDKEYQDLMGRLGLYAPIPEYQDYVLTEIEKW